MFPLLLLFGAGYLLLKMSQQAQASAQPASGTTVLPGMNQGPRGEPLFPPDVAAALLRTLGSADFTVPDPADTNLVQVIPVAPSLVGVSPLLSAATWAQALNPTHSIAASVHLADGALASVHPSAPPQFLVAVAAGHENELSAEFGVILYAGAAPSGVVPGVPSQVVLPDLPPPPTVVATALGELPEPVRGEVGALLSQDADPAMLANLADALDARGYHTAAALVRRRALDLQGAIPPAAGQALPQQSPQFSPPPQAQPSFDPNAPGALPQPGPAPPTIPVQPGLAPTPAPVPPAPPPQNPLSPWLAPPPGQPHRDPSLGPVPAPPPPGGGGGIPPIIINPTQAQPPAGSLPGILHGGLVNPGLITNTSPTMTMYATTTSVNIYERPSMSSRVVGAINFGQPVTVLTMTGGLPPGWLELTADNPGYVCATCPEIPGGPWLDTLPPTSDRPMPAAYR
jgi:hypothetical protein